MSMFHLYAVGVSLVVYLALAVSCFGWGRLVVGALLAREERLLSRYVCPQIWVGWCGVLFLLQVLHLGLPIRWFVTAPVYLTGLYFGILPLWRKVRCAHRPLILWVIIGVPFLLFAAWLASRAMLPVNNYDSGLYHLGAIRWINTYPIVPGLGNLHGRFAFNQSFMVYVASLNIYPVFMHGRSLANSLLLLLSFATCIELVFMNFEDIITRRRGFALRVVAPVFAGFILLFLCLSSTGVQSPSPDLTSTLMQVVIFIFYIRFVMGVFRDQEINRNDIIVLSFMATTAITIKLSNVAFGGVILLVVGVAYLWRKRKLDNFAIKLAFLCGGVFAVYCIRGYILSGAPLYPSLLGYLDFDWAVPRQAVVEEANWAYSWARAPHQHWSTVLGDMGWFRPWLGRLLEMRATVVYPVVIFIFTTVSGFAWSLRNSRRDKKEGVFYLLVILPLMAGFVFWFLTAPDPRFVEGLFLLLPCAGCVFLLSILHESRFAPHTLQMGVLLLVLFGNLHIVHWGLANKWILRIISTQGWHSNPEAEFKVMTTHSGLNVYVPNEGDRAWDGPLPGTPYFNDNLRLRLHEDLRSGFKVRTSVDNVLP